MSWQVKQRVDPDIVDALYQKFQAIAEDARSDYSHLELAAAAQQFIGWIVLNVDCAGCRKATKDSTMAGLKLLFRKADEQAPPTKMLPIEHLH